MIGVTLQTADGRRKQMSTGSRTLPRAGRGPLHIKIYYVFRNNFFYTMFSLLLLSEASFDIVFNLL